MDDVACDPLHPIIRRDATALLVEPVPDCYTRLQHTYAAYPRVRLANVALNVFDGQCIMYRVSSGETQPEWAQGLASLGRNWNGLRDRAVVETIQVECVTWRTLIHRYGVPAVDVLVVDAEGFDDTVVLSFPFQRFHPLCVLYELQNLPIARADIVSSKMRQIGYSVAACDYSDILWIDSSYGWDRVNDRQPALGQRIRGRLRHNRV